VAAVFMGMLNASNRYGVPAFAPVIFNLIMIVFGIFTWRRGGTPEEQVVIWAWGALVGGLGQWVIQIPAAFKIGFRWKLIFSWQDPGLQKIFQLLGPAIIGLSVMQINLFINTIIASFLPQGTVTTLYYGNRLMQLPLGIVAVAIATALLPTSAKQIAEGRLEQLKETLSFGIRLLLAIIIPAAVGLIVLAEPINRLLFQYGRFSASAVHAVAIASMIYTLGLLGYAGVKIIVPTFYALHDSKTPLQAACLSVGANIVLNLWWMHTWGFKGLALAAVIASYINFGYLLYKLRHRLGSLGIRRIVNSAWRISVAALLMGLCIGVLQWAWLPRYDHQKRWVMALGVFAIIGIGMIGYFLFTWLLRVPEQKHLGSWIQTKVQKINPWA
jgi:putative peptidoglycan lipid II flippase